MWRIFFQFILIGICEPIGDPSCLYQRFKCDCMENCDGLYGDITYPGSIGK